MPTRIIRDGILRSQRVNALSQGAELFYRRLMSVVDDFGRYEADSLMLRSDVFPLRVDQISVEDIEQWLSECSDGDEPLLRIYVVNRKRYVEILNFGQRIRESARSKYPTPVQEIREIRGGLQQDAAGGGVPPRIPASRARSSPPTTTSSPTTTDPTSTEPRDEEDAIGFSDWAESAYARHPKKRDKFISLQALQKRFCRDPVARETFERNHELHCETQEWTEKNGAFAPKLWEFVENDGWKYPPIQPSKQNGPGREMKWSLPR